MAANNNSQGSQGSYYSFSEIDVDSWNPTDPNFLTNPDGQTHPPSSSYPATGPAYYSTPQTTAGYATPETPAMSYNASSGYDPSYVPTSSSGGSWQTSPVANASGTANPYLAPASSDQVYTPASSAPIDPAAYDHGTGTWDPNAGSGYSSGYATPQSAVRQTGFRCQYCPDKQYTRSRDLQRHMHARHPGYESPAGDSSEFVECQYCGKQNMRKDNLKRHIEKKHPRYRDTSLIAPRR
ncbi:hypothetical protein MKZ38_006802 [Zalerion maritima]|uniref:C2H2-type domain-containing protein n=1 Tax=Zalerion maritima TaxID=339359 RepID=A0AAD5RV93_9PEZI|nr:hypothetical protein MKZ38_006802 [Zalerion maritima]